MYINDYDSIAMESIFQNTGNELGKNLELEFTRLRKLPNVAFKLANSNISNIIKKYTNLMVTIEDLGYLNAFVHFPDINKNNIMLNNARRKFSTSKSFYEVAKNGILKGEVNLSTGIVHGDFTKIHSRISIPTLMGNKGSILTASESVAILLHEIGHVFCILETTSKLTTTNYLMEEGSKRLMDELNEVERVKIYEILAIEKADTKNLNKEGYKVLILNSSVTKSESETGVNVYNARAFEQLADVYATRMGYGKSLVTALSKMYGNGRFSIARRNNFNNLIVNILKIIGFFLAVYNGYIMVISLVLAQSVQGGQMYDAPKDRSRKIVNQLNDKLKDPKLSKAIKLDTLNAIKVIEEHEEQQYNHKSVTDLIYSVFTSNGRRNDEFNNKQHRLEKLLNNDLFKTATEWELK